MTTTHTMQYQKTQTRWSCIDEDKCLTSPAALKVQTPQILKIHRLQNKVASLEFFNSSEFVKTLSIQHPP